MSSAFLDTGILSLKPLVTFTKRHRPTPLGLAGACPELFAGRRSLHFVSACWALGPQDMAEIASEWRRVSGMLPDALIVFLASTDDDVVRLSRSGVPTVLGNTSILVDEQIFKPLPDYDFADAAYDAIYNARFEPYKRHGLARSIDNLALLYDAPFGGGVSAHEAGIREALPRARFLNHEYGKGRHAPLDKTGIAREINRARCGLCLSAVEGAMRASMEYLMCGVPIVSTHSVGGRDRYYQAPYAILVPDDADAVREATVELRRRKLSKLAIRDHMGRIVEFERKNFLEAVNALARTHLGAARLFDSLAPFIGAQPFTEPESDWSRRRLVPVAQALGVSLPPPRESPARAPESVA
ncbi:MAG TPA: hypothetical protein VN932_03485 [Rhizomicrobium sp.]|nr:hypothetical protein [Rhizomicrobium sp.]